MPVIRAKRNTAIVVGLLVIAGIALAALLLSRGEAPGTTDDARAPRDVLGDRLTETTARRGERPPDQRFQDGAKVVEDPGEALAVARDALRRVEAEIAAAPEEGPQRERLLRKKALIEASIERIMR